jgi:Ca2+-binding RTX toxin-like protein
MATVKGTSNSDVLNSLDGVTSLGDVIYGYGGSDDIYGLGGPDVIFGGAGADFIDGGTGTDTARYDDSSAGVSVFLTTGEGFGGTAEGDSLTSIEDLVGSDYDDYLVGTTGSNSFHGGSGDDVLEGGGGVDFLYGEGDDDILKGGGGADRLYGGSGIDTADYASSWTGVTVVLFSGFTANGEAEDDVLDSIENITGSAYSDKLWGDNGANVLRGLAGNDKLYGESGTDTLWGGKGHDFLYGDAGIDTLRGEDGNDSLDGGTSADTMIGGLGNDKYYVDNANDMIMENGGQGSDEVYTSVSFILPAGADVELLAVDGDDGSYLSLTGNDSGQTIIGNSGNNFIDGSGGVDTMVGGLGDDSYWVDNGGDVVIEDSSSTFDEVYTSVSFTLTVGANVELLRTTNSLGVSPIDLTGNETSQEVRGNDGDNVLNGGDGNDQLTGRGGQDSFVFDTALDAAGNVDALTDFNVADDTIVLENTIFGAFAAGDLAEERFIVGTTPLQDNDNILYDIDAGILYYDSDGNGAAAAVQFATIAPGTALTHQDFIVS